ncbi:MAG: hypothetical protein JWR61_387 [Ferruginibacter sp.]|nr:hypothetical protein [Ferruginibacter sp.]
MKKYYFAGLILLIINIAIFIFFTKTGISKDEGWHVTIYPLNFLLVRAFALSTLLAFLCFIVCQRLKVTKPFAVSALYFICVSIALLLLTIPFLPYKIISVNEIMPTMADTIKLIASAAFYPVFLIHLLLILYFIFSIRKSAQ